MKKLPVIIFCLSSALLFSTNLPALPNSGGTTTFLGPTARIGFNKAFSDVSAFSIAGEGSYHNVRLDGTVGWLLINDQRLKLSAEYLLQNISYSFFSSNTSQWVQQGSVSADYQYELGKYTYLLDPEIDVNAYASRSPGKPLRVDMGTYTPSGVTTTYADDKRIAGADAAGISPGLILSPWEGARAGLNLNYDYVSYDTDYIPSQNTKGFGGTVHLNQALAADMEVGFSAGIRAPFNNYDAHITWVELPFFGIWSVGIAGAYTSGKNRLPSTYNVGLDINYFSIKPKHCSQSEREEALEFLSWTSKPGVYMPQVLAIPDEVVTKNP